SGVGRALRRGQLAADPRILCRERIGLGDQHLLLLTRRRELALLLASLARKRAAAREQLVLDLTLLLRPDCHDLRLRVDPGTHLLRAFAGDVHAVSSRGYERRDSLVLPRDRVAVVQLIQR